MAGGVGRSQFEDPGSHADDVDMIAGPEARLLQPAADQTDFGLEPAVPTVAVFFNLQSANRLG